MKTSVLITAVSGTGKSTVCKALCQLGYDARDLEMLQGLYELIDEKTGQIIHGNLGQIREGLDWNCSTTKLKELVSAQTSDLTFYCGGMSNTEEVWDIFNLVIVLTVSDTITTQRLSTRQLGEFGNIKENRDWVLSWKHDIEQKWLHMGGVEVSAEAAPEEIAQTIVRMAQTVTGSSV